MEYNEEAARALDPFNTRRKELDISFMIQRQFNGIVNALTMVVEEKGWNQDVFNHLCDAILALIETLDSRHKEDLQSLFQECIAEMRRHR